MNDLRTWVVATVIVLGLTACEEQSDSGEPLVRPVRYVTVSGESGERSRVFSGISRSSQESRLSFKVAGTVIELPIQVGAELSRGDLVARLEASQYQLQAQQAQASLVQAQANATNADANYERVKGLYENTNASRNDLDSARANAESAKAQVRAAQKQLELARLNVSYTTLQAAADCSIASVDVELNENVNAGTQVALVNCGQELEVAIAVPESLIGDVNEGMPAEISFNALGQQRFSGAVTEVGVASSGGATFPVTVSLNEPHAELRSGMAAEVSFSFTRSGSGAVYLIPVSAVLNDPDGSFVYIAIPDGNGNEGVLQRRAVTLGELTEHGIEIAAGLEAGDRVVTAGVSLIRNGQRVRL